MSNTKGACSDCNENLEVTSRFVKREGSFKWRIENFSIWPTESYPEIRSPSFNCCSSSWTLDLYPNGDSDDNQGNIGVFLRMVSPDCEKTVKYKMYLKDRNDMRHYENEGHGVFHADGSSQGFSKMIRRDILLKENRAELLCNDILTICCELTVWENVVEGELKRTKLRASIRKGSKAISRIPKGVEILAKDIEVTLKGRKNCDVTLKVGDQLFPAHKWLLSARSRFFAEMFEHDMKESLPSVVTITDVQDTVMNDLLEYIYSGTVNINSIEKAVELYFTAQKHDLSELKDQCSEFLQKNDCQIE